jgi:hypothetical protein
MRNFRISKYKKIDYFVNQNGKKWEVVEFPTNDVVRTFKSKSDAELLSKHIRNNKPFGTRPIPNFLKE